MRRSRALCGVLIGAGLGALGALGASGAIGASAALAAGAERRLELERFNRVYEDVVGELAPLRFDPVTVRLRSPRQVISVRDHTAILRPLGGGRVDGVLELDLLGKGELIAELDLAGRVSTISDTLILPPQIVRLEGAARIERIEGGYRVRPERLPAGVRVEIRSNLINQAVALCDTAALLSLGAIDCAPLGPALERPTVPLGAVADAELVLADAELDAEERSALDALIAAQAP